MYRDKTLIPTEAIRLAALGVLAGRPEGDPVRYGDLAAEVRYFVSHIMGPSLDVLGPSIELLRYEGLAAFQVGGEGGEADGNARLSLTDAGRDELLNLLRANVRAPIDDVNKLVIALKFRFLHLLPKDQQRDQIDRLIELFTAEQGRLAELLEHHTDNAGGLAAWLIHDLAQTEQRIAWLENFKAKL